MKQSEKIQKKADKISIVKQSLLFQDEKASESIFKIAETLDLGLEDYISD